MNNKLILLLRLEGVLQSWGERAKWNRRDSATVPTKSGVIGLISCAMGLPRTDVKIILLNRRLKVSVRVDRAGVLLNDFHTVRGKIGTAEGKQRGSKEDEATIVTDRQYLQDASFLAALTGDSDTLEECAAALRSPVWQLYLGRKCCVPTSPVFESLTDEYSSVEEAFSKYPTAERCDGTRLTIQTEGGYTLRRDEQVHSNRGYAMRGVTRKTAEVEHVSVKADTQ